MTTRKSPVANRRIPKDDPFSQTEVAPKREEAIDIKKVSTIKPIRVKRTFHIEQDAIFLLEELQTKRFRETQRKPELSELVSEAIRLLGQADQPDAQAS